MAEPRDSETGAPTQEEALERWRVLGEQSGRVVQSFFERQAADGGFQTVNPASVGRAFFEFTNTMMSDPAKLMEAQMALWQDNLQLWQTMQRRAMGEPAAPIIEPAPGDRRFKDKSWEEEALFDFLKQSYLLTARWTQDLVGQVEGVDDETRRKVDFFTRQYLSAMAPSNFALTNPAVLRKTKASNGENLVTGLKHLLDDLEKGKGRLQISMTDMAAFKVGENVAVSAGKVVFQNDLMQLIQYAPSTEKVYKRPLLIVPPWINKFYVLDLQPRNSFVKWAVDQGYTVFVISWVNPRKDLSHKSFDDYMLEGPLAALDAITEATGEAEINLLGFCIGGILTTATLAYLAAKGDDRVKAVSFLATMVDLKEVGEVSVFIDEEQLQSLEQHIAETGYLEGHHMATMFNMMRENDLIWSFVVNNYLMGQDPMPFDLLYWNADSTRLPATMLVFYLRQVYQRNLLIKPGGLTLDGVAIDLGKVRTPTYAVATKEDHIAPWKSCYPLTQAFSGPVRFVLGASGHIAGIINPPTRTKYGYWTNSKRPADPDRWLDGAEAHEGSWWPDWHRWLARKSGKKVDARVPGSGKLPAIEDAPGSYVKVRASE